MVVIVSQLFIFLWLLLSGKADRKVIVYALIAAVAMLLAFAPWLPVVWQDNKISAYWAQMPTYDFLVIYYFIYLGHNKFLILLFGLLGMFLFINTWFGQKKIVCQEGSWSSRKIFLFLTFWLTLSYLIPLVYSFIKMPMLHERYTIIALPAMFVLVALGFNCIHHYVLRVALVAAIILSTIHNFTYVTKYYTAISKNQYREVVQAVIHTNEQESFTNDIKLFSDQAWHYNFYFETLGAPNRVVTGVGRNMPTELDGIKQVWILQGLASEGIDSSQQSFLKKNFVLTKKLQFVGAAALLYTHKNVLMVTK
jgi:uncharacterized membrane protein YhdT